METLSQLLVFTLDEYRYALHLSAVERVFRAVEITPLPKAPEIVSGVVNIQGRIVPVFDVRKRFRLPEREMDLSDWLILARTPRRSVALLVDSVRGVIESPKQDVVASQNFLPRVEYLEGVVKLQDGIVLIHDIDTFLSLDEEETLSGAMENMGTRNGL